MHHISIYTPSTPNDTSPIRQSTLLLHLDSRLATYTDSISTLANTATQHVQSDSSTLQHQFTLSYSVGSPNTRINCIEQYTSFLSNYPEASIYQPFPELSIPRNTLTPPTMCSYCTYKFKCGCTKRQLRVRCAESVRNGIECADNGDPRNSDLLEGGYCDECREKAEKDGTK